MKKRFLAMLLVVAMVAGMVPVTTFASAKKVDSDDVLPNILVDGFSDDRYTSGTRYKWAEFDGSQNTTREFINLKNGYYQVTNMYSSQSNKNFLSNYLTAINMATGEDYAQNWTNYSVEMNYRVDEFDPVIEGDEAATDALNVAKKKGTMLVMGRLQNHADGSMTFYAAGFQYANPDDEVNYDKVTKFLLYKGKRYGAEDGYKVTLTSIGSYSVSFSLNTFHTVKLSFVDNNIEAFLDGESVIQVQDNEYTAGTVGFMLNRSGSMTVNDFKVVHEDDVSVFTDEFVDSRYIDGLVHTWTPDNKDAWASIDGALVHGAAGDAGVEYDPIAVASKWNIMDMYPSDVIRDGISQDGLLTFVSNNTAASDKSQVTTYLTLASTVGDQTANWTNYAVEAGLRFSDAPGNSSKLGVMGRVQIDDKGNGSYYYAAMRYGSNSIYLYKATVTNGELKISNVNTASNAFTFSADAVHNIKMTFRGNTITVSVDGNDCITYVDEANTCTAGGVGVSLVRKGAGAADYIKVTDVFGEPLFTEEFADASRLSETGEAGYMLGAVYNKGAIPIKQEDIKELVAKWSYFNKYTDVSALIQDNKYLYIRNNDNASSGNNYAHALISLLDGDTDIASQWSDYSIESKLTPAVFKADANNIYRTRFSIFGRFHKNEDGSISYYAAGLRADTKSLYLWYVTIGADGTHTAKELASAAALSETPVIGNDYTIKMTFKGNAISVSLNGENKINYETVGDNAQYAIPSGTAGVRIVRGGTILFDYVKVTDGANNVMFEEDFETDDHLLNTGYKCYSTKGVFSLTKPEASQDDTTGEATPAEKKSSVNLITGISGDVDYMQTLKDYILETDFLLENEDSVAGIVARATDGGYYEMRITKDKVSFWKVTKTEEVQIANVAATPAIGVWQYAKLVVEGAVIKAYLGTTELFIYDAATHFAVGSFGVKATGSVKFDNFAASPTDATEVRKYRTFKFKAADVSALSDWHLISDEWSVEDITQVNPLTGEDYLVPMLTSQVATGTAMAQLGYKRALDNYAAETKITLSAHGTIGLAGRVSTDGNDYYMFRINTTTGAELVKVIDGNETVLNSISFLDLYINGTKLQPEEFYTLKLQMYGNVIEGYVDGNLVLRATDAQNQLVEGTTGIFGSKGASFEYVSLSTVDVVTSIEIVTLTDAQGKAIWTQKDILAATGDPDSFGYNPNAVRSYPVATEANPVQVFQGKVPDIKNTWLKINYYDGTVGYIELDKADVVEAFDGATTGAKQSKVEYLNATTVFYYTVGNRAADIAQIKQELAQLQIPTSLDSETYIKDLYARFSDLSYTELVASGIPTDSIKKLYDAMDAIDVLCSPELAGTDVLFRDTFDTSASESKYNSDSANLTWRGNPGKWYVENGTMYEYTTDDHTYPVRLSASAVVVDENGVPENWEIRSVSVDVQFITTTTRAGFDFCFGGPHEERYNLNITDKDNRVTLNSNKAILDQAYAERDYGIEFVPGVWYNIRVTLDGNGLMRCYVNGRMWFKYQITPNASEDHILTHGSVALYTSENHARFDNLVVRGVGKGEDFEEDYYNSLGNDYVDGTGEYRDNFDDEVAGKNPSHWIELNTEDKWLVKEDGTNKVYATKDNTKTNSHTWLHVFETNVDYSANIKVTEKGYLPVVALSSRVNADESFIRSGYDFSLQKWYISVRMGADFEPVITYSDATDAAAAEKFLTDGVNLRVKLVNKAIELYADGVKVLTADADLKVMPGRVGVYTEQCNIEIDDVVLKLLSGQGKVNEGVLEYYTNTGSSYHSILEMWDDDGNQILLLYQDGIQSISVDGGQTFKLSTMFSDAGFKGNSSLELHDGTYINIKTRGGSDESIKSQRWVYYSKDGGKTWPHVGVVCTRPFASYAQPAEHINEVRLNETTWRVFYSLTCGDTGHSEVFYTDYVEGMDNFGEVWHASKNTPSDFVNIGGFNESYVIQISKDTVDRNGMEIPAGTLIQYSSHNECNTMRYTLSYDNGETWVGDYAMPEIPCGDNSCCVKEDPYEPGTYYMVAPYNLSPGFGFNHPRFRNVLLRSYDGLNWEFLADVDRWGQITDYNHANIMQQVNAYICITEDYVFPTFSRSDQILADASHSHQMQIGRLYRFEKDKLQAYEQWPTEYVIPDKEITSIEVTPGKTRVDLNDSDPLAGTKVKVNYYNAESEIFDLAELMDMKDADKPRAFAVLPDLSTAGIKSVAIDYRHFRAVYTLQVGLTDSPVISWIEEGKTYCYDPQVYVGDADGDLDTVTVNGIVVELNDGVFSVSAKEGKQTIVATDKKGHSSTITITVNAGHTWSEEYTNGNGRHWKTCTVEGCDSDGTKYACSGGEATCTELAVCSTCGNAYGKLAKHEFVNGKCVCGEIEAAGEQPGNANFFTMIIDFIWSLIQKLLALLGLA